MARDFGARRAGPQKGGFLNSSDPASSSNRLRTDDEYSYKASVIVVQLETI
jgi:hypothetical protein